ncbi:hypothetical protein BDK51DRAFT_26974, partial [Blyttiomyces helicus]
MADEIEPGLTTTQIAANMEADYSKTSAFNLIPPGHNGRTQRGIVKLVFHDAEAFTQWSSFLAAAPESRRYTPGISPRPPPPIPASRTVGAAALQQPNSSTSRRVRFQSIRQSVLPERRTVSWDGARLKDSLDRRRLTEYRAEGADGASTALSGPGEKSLQRVFPRLRRSRHLTGSEPAIQQPSMRSRSPGPVSNKRILTLVFLFVASFSAATFSAWQLGMLYRDAPVYLADRLVTTEAPAPPGPTELGAVFRDAAVKVAAPPVTTAVPALPMPMRLEVPALPVMTEAPAPAVEPAVPARPVKPATQPVKPAARPVKPAARPVKPAVPALPMRMEVPALPVMTEAPAPPITPAVPVLPVTTEDHVQEVTTAVPALLVTTEANALPVTTSVPDLLVTPEAPVPPVIPADPSLPEKMEAPAPPVAAEAPPNKLESSTTTPSSQPVPRPAHIRARPIRRPALRRPVTAKIVKPPVVPATAKTVKPPEPPLCAPFDLPGYIGHEGTPQWHPMFLEEKRITRGWREAARRKASQQSAGSQLVEGTGCRYMEPVDWVRRLQYGEEIPFLKNKVLMFVGDSQ